MLRLAAGDVDNAVRRRLPAAELTRGRPDVQEVLDALVEARLLTADDGSVEVAHEALLREWPRMRDWLEEERESRRLEAHLRGRGARVGGRRARPRGSLPRREALGAARLAGRAPRRARAGRATSSSPRAGRRANGSYRLNGCGTGVCARSRAASSPCSSWRCWPAVRRCCNAEPHVARHASGSRASSAPRR